jgi:hypothetical protein
VSEDGGDKIGLAVGLTSLDIRSRVTDQHDKLGRPLPLAEREVEVIPESFERLEAAAELVIHLTCPRVRHDPALGLAMRYQRLDTAGETVMRDNDEVGLVRKQVPRLTPFDFRDRVIPSRFRRLVASETGHVVLECQRVVAGPAVDVLGTEGELRGRERVRHVEEADLVRTEALDLELRRAGLARVREIQPPAASC